MKFYLHEAAKAENTAAIIFSLQRFEKKIPCGSPGGEGTHTFSVRGRAAEQGIIFRIPSPGQGMVFVKNQLHDRVHICHFLLPKVVLGHLHSANVIQIALMAIFLHFSIDLVQISLQSTKFVRRN